MTNRNWKEQMVVLFIGGSFKKEKKRGLSVFLWFMKIAKGWLGELGVLFGL